MFVADISIGLKHVRSIRLLYNRGAQGHGKRNDEGQLTGRPDRVSLPYDSSGQRYAYSDRWLTSALDGRNLLDAGVPPEVSAQTRMDVLAAPSARPNLVLHARYSRAAIFGAVGVAYTQRSQNLNVGLPPRNPDGSYFIFITLDKEQLDASFAYQRRALPRLLQVGHPEGSRGGPPGLREPSGPKRARLSLRSPSPARRLRLPRCTEGTKRIDSSQMQLTNASSRTTCSPSTHSCHRTSSTS